VATNIEIKAYCTNPEQAHAAAARLATHTVGRDLQTDTYFKTTKGRFKLRESSLSGAYLVPYLRADNENARASVYQKIPVDDAAAVKDLFSQLLGRHRVVRKERMIYLYHNVRIHLDQVEGLGAFIELEAVMSEEYSDEQTERDKLDFLMRQLGIRPTDLIATSYEALAGIGDK
jgi:adenylate cyclase class 2